ncbi:hypothetical protein EJB05_26417, partial [Eragrostis curvula]
MHTLHTLVFFGHDRLDIWRKLHPATRAMLVLANAFLMVGALAMSLGIFPALMPTRFVTSVSVGFSVPVAPVYVAEIASAWARGFLTSIVDIFITVGILLSYVTNYALGVAPPVLLAAGVLAMPESPRWLAILVVYAHAMLARTSNSTAEWMTGSRRSGTSSRRRSAAPACASGIDAIVLYSPLIFKQAGISSDCAALAATVAMGVVKMLTIFVAMFLSDRIGRRPLLLASAAAIVASLTVLGATLCIHPTTPASSAMCVAAVLAFITAFLVRLGPLAPAYDAEILPLRLHAQGTGLGIAANRLTCGILSMTFISLANTISMAGCFFLYASTAVAAWVFVYVRLPETKGRNLEGMEVLFAK